MAALPDALLDGIDLGSPRAPMSDASFVAFLTRLLDDDDDSPNALVRSTCTTVYESDEVLRARFARVFLSIWQARIAVAALTSDGDTGLAGARWLRKFAPGAEAASVARVVLERVVDQRSLGASQGRL